MEPCSPEIFVVEPGAQSLSQLGARTKMLFAWTRALNFPSWSPAFFRPEPWSPGALNPFGTLPSIVTPAKSWVKALWHFSTLPLTYRSYLKECRPCISAASSQQQCSTIDFYLFLDIVDAEMLIWLVIAVIVTYWNLVWLCYCCHLCI